MYKKIPTALIVFDIDFSNDLDCSEYSLLKGDNGKTQTEFFPLLHILFFYNYMSIRLPYLSCTTDSMWAFAS